MNKIEFTDLKKNYINFVKKYTINEGGMFPHVSIFTKNENDKPSIIHVPIPDEYMETDANKDEFVDELLPKLGEAICEDFDVFGIAWSSEAWVRVASRDEEVNDYKSLPIKEEVLIIHVESDFGNEFNIYKIKRNGSQVTSEGDLVDKITLTKDREMSKLNPGTKGRFSGLLSKIKKGGRNA